MADSDQDHLFRDFIAESLDHLEIIEPDLLVMEEKGEKTPKEIINRVFRAIHTVKGAAGFFGFSIVSDLSHAMEGLLTRIRNKEVTPDLSIIDALLKGIDELRLALNDPDAPRKTSVDTLVSQIHDLFEKPRENVLKTTHADSEKTSENPSATTVFKKKDKLCVALVSEYGTRMLDVDPDNISKLAGKQVFGLWIDLDKDLYQKDRTIEDLKSEANSFGECIGYDFGSSSDSESGQKSAKDKGSMGVLLFATVLEPDLVSEALDIDQSRIMVIEKEAFEHPTEQKSGEKKNEDSGKPSGSKPEVSECVMPTASVIPDTLRVNLDLLDKLMNLAGELVLGRNQLRRLLGDTIYENPMLGSVSQSVDRVTTEMQEHIMQMRMQPVGKVLERFKRLTRDLSRQHKKNVKLVITGGDVELDKSILEGLSDPMTHLIRNCVDHGIELPEERKRLGKPPEGTIDIKAFHKAGQVIITVSDDGRGIDIDKVVEKAITQGLVTPDEVSRMTETEKVDLVFFPGVSTADTISSLSGRGVGMDVVKTNIEKCGGSLEIRGVPKKGTTIRIRLPLTLAIIPSLIVAAGKMRFAIPQINISELVCIQVSEAARRIEKVGQNDVLRLRENLLPLVRLSDILGIERYFFHPKLGQKIPDRRERVADRRQESKLSPEEKKINEKRRKKTDRRQRRQGDIYVVVSRLGGHSFGIIVNQLYDIEEIVVKPLSRHIKNCKCYAGATIMGDGRVGMILDTAGVAEMSEIRFSEIESEHRRRLEMERQRRQENLIPTLEFLLFSSGKDEQFGLMLSQVARLEMITPDQIEKVGSQRFFTHSGISLPLIRLDQVLRVSPFPENQVEIYLIIPKFFQIGILASRVIDIFSQPLALQKSAATAEGLSGTAIINDKITLFPDLEQVMALLKRGERQMIDTTINESELVMPPLE